MQLVAGVDRGSLSAVLSEHYLLHLSEVRRPKQGAAYMAICACGGLEPERVGTRDAAIGLWSFHVSTVAIGSA